MKHICEECKNEISPVDVVCCPNCGKSYHSWCWTNVVNCITCGKENEDYLKSMLDRSDNRSDYQKQKENEEQLNSVLDNSDNNKLYHQFLNIDMYSNIGKQIKGLATFISIAGIVAGIFTLIIMANFDDDLVLIGLFIGCIIALLSWVGSFALAGFGTLISSSQNTERLLRDVLKEIKK